MSLYLFKLRGLNRRRLNAVLISLQVLSGLIQFILGRLILLYKKKPLSCFKTKHQSGKKNILYLQICIKH